MLTILTKLHTYHHAVWLLLLFWLHLLQVHIRLGLLFDVLPVHYVRENICYIKTYSILYNMAMFCCYNICEQFV